MYFILEDICSHRDGPKHQNIWMPKKRMHLKNGGTPPPQNGIEKKAGNDDEPSGIWGNYIVYVKYVRHYMEQSFPTTFFK